MFERVRLGIFLFYFPFSMNFNLHDQAFFDPLYCVTQSISFLRKYNHVDLSRYIKNYCAFSSDFEETGTMGLRMLTHGDNDKPRRKSARCFVI